MHFVNSDGNCLEPVDIKLSVVKKAMKSLSTIGGLSQKQFISKRNRFSIWWFVFFWSQSVKGRRQNPFMNPVCN